VHIAELHAAIDLVLSGGLERCELNRMRFGVDDMSRS
jgi:hypothetical protein